DDDAKIGGGKVSRRGRTAGIAGGGGAIVVIAVFLISQFLGVYLTPFLGGGTQGGGTEATPVAGCETGADANTDIDCRMEATAESLDAYWSDQAAAAGITYSTPAFYLFTDATPTGCGNATSAVGPFYCP
ncbi:neutral zinc metallopeptidase, partial [Rhizobium johnstonii]|uniref:neutral zinc metallopeptidase n=1 Tax=Rhizobium johnstonii TaxID=3019933 RepID=UPI003F9D7278